MDNPTPIGSKKDSKDREYRGDNESSTGHRINDLVRGRKMLRMLCVCIFMPPIFLPVSSFVARLAKDVARHTTLQFETLCYS